ncbi:hypothetical protein GCM10022384_32150 [Streptomyces marokkonensis]|uniref:Uncharacterized protein n=1 Tax=Streptomyces marokkonensis TaxID=324855 RepID=A0ABP7QDB0_9ACTN
MPARYAGYQALIRHPVLLARQADIQVQHEIRVARTALQTSRADLPRLGLPESVIDHTIKLYAAEVLQLQHHRAQRTGGHRGTGRAGRC